MGKNLAYGTNQGVNGWELWVNKASKTLFPVNFTNDLGKQVTGCGFEIKNVSSGFVMYMLYKKVNVRALMPDTDYNVVAQIQSSKNIDTLILSIQNHQSKNTFTNAVRTSIEGGKWTYINVTLHTIASFESLDLTEERLGIYIRSNAITEDTNIIIGNLQIYDSSINLFNYEDGFIKEYYAPCTIQPIKPVTTIVGADSVTYYPKIQSYVDKKIAQISSAIVGE